jgi:hypothetical protein
VLGVSGVVSVVRDAAWGSWFGAEVRNEKSAGTWTALGMVIIYFVTACRVESIQRTIVNMKLRGTESNSKRSFLVPFIELCPDRPDYPDQCSCFAKTVITHVTSPGSVPDRSLISVAS